MRRVTPSPAAGHVHRAAPIATQVDNKRKTGTDVRARWGQVNFDFITEKKPLIAWTKKKEKLIFSCPSFVRRFDLLYLV